MGLFSNLSFRKRSQPELAASPEAATGALAAAGLVPAPEAGLVPELPVAQVLSAEERAQVDGIVRRVVQELPTFSTVAVIEAATGNILAGQWAGHSGGAVEVALSNAEMVRQTRLAIQALQLADTEQLTDILVTLRHELHLLRVLSQPAWLLYLAVRTQDTNAALARSVMQMIDN